MLTQICSHCTAVLSLDDSQIIDPDEFSHGICRECMDTFLADVRENFDDYLDSFEQPVMVVDSEGLVQTANDKACEMLQKDRTDFHGYKGGSVFGCVHADEPCGCGSTVHCLSYTTRNTVMKTFETGESCIRVPASLDLDKAAGIATVTFLISTK